MYDTETENLKTEMAQTRMALAEKIETLENKVADTVANASDAIEESVGKATSAVNDTVDSVKAAVSATGDTVQSTVMAVKDNLLIGAVHLPFPGIGRLRHRDGGGFVYDPLPWQLY